MDEKAVGNARYSRKLQLMLRILKSISGQALRDRFLNQQILVRVSIFSFNILAVTNVLPMIGRRDIYKHR